MLEVCLIMLIIENQLLKIMILIPDPECNSGLVGMLKWDKQHFLCAAGNNKVPCFGDSG